MTDNLDSQYDQVVDYIKGYSRYVNKISMRFVLLSLRSIKYYWLQTQLVLTVFRQDPLSGKNVEFLKTPVSICATEAERANDYFSVVMSDYLRDTLSDLLISKFGDVDFDKLKKLHDLKKSQLSIISMQYFVGLILGAATVVLKSIPKKIVEENIGLSYEDFEVKVFWVMLGALAYVVVSILPAWIMTIRARYVHWYVGSILEYTAIKYE